MKSLRFYTILLPTVLLLSTYFLIGSHLLIKPQAASNTITFQGKVVNLSNGTNLVTGTPACVLAGADTCDFQIRIWNHITNNNAAAGGNLMFTQTFQDVEIGSYNGVFTLEINSCGSAVSGTSQWGTSVGTCTVVDDSDADSDPGVNFSRSDLYVEVGFATTNTSGSLGSFTELFTRKRLTQVPAAFYADRSGSADTLDNIDSTGFVQLQPNAAQTATNTTNALINLNETGAGTPTLLNLAVGGTTVFQVDNNGNIGVGNAATSTSNITVTESSTADIINSTDGTNDIFRVDSDGNTIIGDEDVPQVDLTVYGDMIQGDNKESLGITGITDIFIYDTAKDSDLGAWTNSDTSKQLSWYTETKDDGVNDACNIASDDRCGSSEFPKKAVIISTASNVYIFDARNNKLWMRFAQGTNFALGADTNNNPSSVTALDGSIYVSMSGSSATSVIEVDVKNDAMHAYTSTGRSTGTTTISTRNSSVAYTSNTISSMQVSGAPFFSIHANRVEGILFFAVGSDRGIVIVNKSEQKSFTYSSSDADDYNAVWLTSAGDIYALNGTKSKLERWNKIQDYQIGRGNGTTDRTWDQESVPALTSAAPTISANFPNALFVRDNIIYVGTNRGLSKVVDDLGNEGRITGDIYQPFSATNQTQLTNATNDQGMVTFKIAGVTYIYLIGGWTNPGPVVSATVYRSALDTNGNIGTWSTSGQTALPAAMREQAVVGLDINGSKYIYNVGGQVAGLAYTNAVYKGTVDSSGNITGWTTVSQGQLPAAYGHIGLDVTNVNGTYYIYALGGYNGTVWNGNVYRAAIDSSGNVGTWSAASQTQLTTVYASGIAEHRAMIADIAGAKYIYVLGGYNGTSAVNTIYRAVIDSSGNIGAWSTSGQGTLATAEGEFGFATTIINGKYYAYTVAGFTTGYSNIVAKGAIDPVTGNMSTFTAVNQNQYPEALSGMNYGVVISEVGGKKYIYGIGGENSSGVPVTSVYRSIIANFNQGSVKYITQEYETEEMIDDIRGMWGFNGGFGSSDNEDLSNRGNTLTTLANIDLSDVVPGVRNRTYDLDGSTEYLQCADAACGGIGKLDIGTGEWSIGAWIKTTKTTLQAIASKGTASGQYSYYLATGQSNDGRADYLLLNTANGIYITADGATFVADGKWHYVVGTYDGATARIYVDGKLDGASATKSGTQVTDSTSNFQIGARTDNGGMYFQGQIDELFVTAESVTDDEVARLYQSGRKALEKRNIEVTDATTVSSTTIGDSGETWSANEFVGTIVGIEGGTGSGQTRKVISNTATTLTVSPAWSVTPDTTSDFAIRSHRLYGTSNIVSAIDVEGDNMYIGTNSGSGTGGITVMDIKGDVITDVFQGASGKIDDAGTSWASTYDDISAVDADKGLEIFSSANHYWYEMEGESIASEINNVKENIENLSNGALIDTHRQELATDKSVGRQIVRKGWNFVTSTASTSYAKNINFGITFEDVPITIASFAGYAGTSDPLSINDCAIGSAALREISVQQLRPAGFTGLMYRTDNVNDGVGYRFCFTWIAIGTYKEGGTSYGGGADLAENYLTYDTTVESGDVVGIDTENDIAVKKTSKAYDESAIGIVATQPSITIGPEDGTTPGVETSIKGTEVGNGAKTVPVALAGRVPVKVTLENGVIKRGDYLTPSSKPGYAMKATKAGVTIGRALEDFDGKSTIEDNLETLERIDEIVTENEIRPFDSAQGDTKKEKSEELEARSSELAASMDGYSGKVMTFVQPGYYWGSVQNAITEIIPVEEIDAEVPDIKDYNLKNIGNFIKLNKDGDYYKLGGLTIDASDNSISSTNQDLSLQTGSDKSVDIFNSKIVISSNGAILTDSIAVNNLMADTIEIANLKAKSDLAGSLVIKQGQKQTSVEFPKELVNYSVLLTPLIRDSKVQKRANGFDIILNEEAKQDLFLDYLIIEK